MGESERISIGIVGASGYGGVQLVRLLQAHPQVEIAYLGGDASAGKSFGELYPHLGQQIELTIEPIDVAVIAERCQVAFLSLPHGLAYQLAPDLLARGCWAIDLSADYRFANLEAYSAVYGIPRNDPEAASLAVYGLPELYRTELLGARLVGCPGCYPTASLLALAPLLKQGLIELESIIIDAKSGTSGGGRKRKTNLLLAEADSSVGPYGVAGHRHTPEIERVASDLAGQDVRLQFVPHLMPMVRGMLATVYARLRDPGLVREDLQTIYHAFYRSAPFVRLLPSGVYPQTKWATATNACFLAIEVDRRTDRIVVMSAIDNLMKGQASQAIQCLNIAMGWDETLGLPQVGFYP